MVLDNCPNCYKIIRIEDYEVGRKNLCEECLVIEINKTNKRIKENKNDIKSI